MVFISSINNIVINLTVQLGQLSREPSRVKKATRREEKANHKLIEYFVKINEDHVLGMKVNLRNRSNLRKYVRCF